MRYSLRNKEKADKLPYRLCILSHIRIAPLPVTRQTVVWLFTIHPPYKRARSYSSAGLPPHSSQPAGSLCFIFLAPLFHFLYNCNYSRHTIPWQVFLCIFCIFIRIYSQLYEILYNFILRKYHQHLRLLP